MVDCHCCIQLDIEGFEYNPKLDWWRGPWHGVMCSFAPGFHVTAPKAS